MIRQWLIARFVLYPPIGILAFSATSPMADTVQYWNDIVGMGQGGYLLPYWLVREVVFKIKAGKICGVKEADDAKGFGKFDKDRDNDIHSDDGWADFIIDFQRGAIK